MSALIQLAGIHFAYPGRSMVLDDVSLGLEAGERLCLTGPNGVGKSTLLRIIVGLLKPSKGSLIAFGKERVSEQDFREVRCKAGLLFQDADDQLFCPTVAEDVSFGPLNLGLPKDQVRERVETTLDRLGLLTLKDRVTHHLSGGEKRLVSLAGVLAMEPRVLLLDEPTNALDDANLARLTEILSELDQAMIIVSHDPAFRNQLATRTAHLAAGRLTA
ncbi:MAG: energy-coupling factor ABC transporter ATP-binding protein [Magnetovibrionaceae bacterium]